MLDQPKITDSELADNLISFQGFFEYLVIKNLWTSSINKEKLKIIEKLRFSQLRTSSILTANW